MHLQPSEPVQKACFTQRLVWYRQEVAFTLGAAARVWYRRVWATDGGGTAGRRGGNLFGVFLSSATLLSLSRSHTCAARHWSLFIKLTCICFGRSLVWHSSRRSSSPTAPPSAVFFLTPSLHHALSNLKIDFALLPNLLSLSRMNSRCSHFLSSPPLPWPIFGKAFWWRKWKAAGRRGVEDTWLPALRPPPD